MNRVTEAALHFLWNMYFRPIRSDSPAEDHSSIEVGLWNVVGPELLISLSWKLSPYTLDSESGSLVRSENEELMQDSFFCTQALLNAVRVE